MRDFAFSRFLFAFILTIGLSVDAHADDLQWKAPSRFTEVGFFHATMEQDGQPQLKSDVGFSLTSVKTFYLHKPIAQRLRFGIEAVWSSVAYANYKVNYISMLNSLNNIRKTYHTFNYTLQAGLGCNFNMTQQASAHAYLRYAPGYSGLYDGEDLMGGFLNSCVGGLVINYRKIGIGVEWRFGTTHHSSLIAKYAPDLYEQLTTQIDKKVKTKIHSVGVYLALTL